MFSKVCFLLLGTVMGLALDSRSAPAFAQEPFYKGKTLRLLVNFTAGGPTDIFARLMARYLSKHIPGTPGVIVENMGGAGGIIGANHVYGAAKPDGLTVGVFSGSHVAQILASSGVRYDLRNMPIIAGAAETSVVLIRADTGVKAASDLLTLQKPIAAPPKTPSEPVQILRSSFRQTFEDPEFKAESDRILRFQLMTFVGDDAEKVNAAVFRAGTGPALEVLQKMARYQ